MTALDSSLSNLVKCSSHLDRDSQPRKEKMAALQKRGSKGLASKLTFPSSHICQHVHTHFTPQNVPNLCYVVIIFPILAPTDGHRKCIQKARKSPVLKQIFSPFPFITPFPNAFYPSFQCPFYFHFLYPVFPFSDTLRLFTPVSHTLFTTISYKLFTPVSNTLITPILFLPFLGQFLPLPLFQSCTHVQCSVPNVRIPHKKD